MMNPKSTKETKDFSLFPSFSDLPDPQVEEIVEPKSFRNTLIRALLWMATIPAFALFFLLHHQIQLATNDADNVQLSIAQNIASRTSNFIFSTVKMVRFSMDLMSFNDNNPVALHSMLNSLAQQQSNLVYGAWLDKNYNFLAVRTTENSSYFPKIEELKKLPLVNQNSLYISKISEDLLHVTIVQKMPIANGDFLFFVGVMRLTPLVNLIKGISQEQRFSVLLLEGNERVIFDSTVTSNQEVLSLSPIDWEKIHKAPNGCIIRSPGTRNIAEVRTFVYIPELKWTVLVSEPLLQRDALIRSSTETALIVLLVTFAASILVGIFIAGPLSRSVNELTDAVRRFGRSGKFDSSLVNTLEKVGTTELIALGQSFESMAHNIQQSNAKLSKLNTDLEKQVSNRTATILLRNRELRALHRLLIPIQPSSNRTEIDLVEQSIEEFRSLLGLSKLNFVPIENSTEHSDVFAEAQQRVPIVIGTHQFGWLEVGETDLLTADRLESLLRLANSLSILFANKNLVNQLEKEHATLATVFESMTDGIIIIGRSGRVIYANDLAAKMLNSSQPIVGKEAYRLVFEHWKPTNESIASIEELGEATHFVPKESKSSSKPQTIDIVSFKVSDLPGFSGERTGLLIRDITHEAEIESMKDNLMSVVAHELKTPVTAVRLQAESLRHFILGKKEINLTDIEELIEESARLGQLIDDMLDISRIEGGAMKLVPKVVQIASLIDRATRLTLSRYAIHIERTIDPDAETFLADPDRITQVFINLFNNAARYKKDSQSVAKCTVNVAPQDEFVRIEITDFGRGIPVEIIDNIFDRFYQANMTDHRVSGGTGLGLSIVRGIVEAHGGSITVESVLEEYTRFVILLPY